MGAPHGHRLHFHGHSWVHRLPAHVKLVALVAFMLTVVATPREWYPVFAGYFLLLFVLVAISHVPPTYLAKRMVVEVPFVVFAALLPFVATGPQVEVLGLSLSEQGLLGAWGLLVKGTLGVLASLLLAATTEPRALLAGLERLRMPPLLVQIMGFMIRYLDVVTDELRRMHVARESRGFSARDPRQWPVIAKSAGVLFIRSYERGERVHLAMLSRGYDGRMPTVSVPVLDLQGVAFAYPDGHQALHGVDLHVHQGERVALLGPNGAGKTTLVLHLNGILMPGLGSVAVSGLPVTKREPPRGPASRRHRVPGPRRPAVHGHGPRGRRLRAQEPRPARAPSSSAGCCEALEAVGMAEYADRPPHHLSFGQRRRVAVATVLAMQPEVLVLDEPSSNLDPASRRELADILRSLDVTVLLVTHDLPYALELCPRSVILSDGVVAADGPTADILGDDALMKAHRLELPFGFVPSSRV